MNLFVLDIDPVKAAQQQCDKHVVKMIVESAQMLSTAHRLLDGTQKIEKRYVNGSLPARYRNVKVWTLEDKDMNDKLYRACHASHPCTIWTTESEANYSWHYAHFIALCNEYTYRYGKIHKTDSALRSILLNTPKNISRKGLTEFKLAMKSNPECMIKHDPVQSYRLFYQTKQDRFKMKWTNRPIPDWFVSKNEV